MLVLSRKRDQELVITAGGHEITVSVLEVSGGKVRLGLIGGEGVSIHRRELFEKIYGRGPKRTTASVLDARD